ncbi:MAG: ABC transporter substrate-binding protein [Proteobacteria bacterium]|jgi:phospholipid transport system substrate-binding protein|nr:ABC transporter substrate-binding protein [Pseudomonadota bacterium]MCG6935203.1 ABC transporter substrate-binding protein [Pseudomonadota bacterium]
MKRSSISIHHFSGRQAWLALFISMTAWLGLAQAENTADPRELLESSSRLMVAQLNANQDEIRRNPQVVNQLVEEYILPHIDFISASKWVLGKHWRRASQEQKLDFVRQFRTLLLHFYSSGLAEYLSNNTIDVEMFEFLPLRTPLGDKRATVHMKVHTPGGKVVPVKYSMHLSRDGWKVYDVAVEGISLATTYRNSFATVISQQGIDGLIASLAEKNQRLLAGQRIQVN